MHFLSLHHLIFIFPFIIYISDPVNSQCKNSPVIFNFGDSNSDTGGLVSGLGFLINSPYGRSFFHKSTGRLSDGRLVIDFLCQSVKTSLLRPYLDSLGSKFTNGANFAVVGSSTLPKYVPFSLNIQIMQFIHFKAKSLELEAAGGDISLVDDEGFRNALYMIDIGQNDTTRKKGFSDRQKLSRNAYLDIGQYVKYTHVKVTKKIPTIIAEIKNAIKTIYDQGGRKFWIHNTGPLGCLPQKLSLVQKTTHDRHGCLSNYNDAARLFNDQLRYLCQEMRVELKDAKIVYVDIFAIKYSLIANSTTYGFASPLMACCGHGGPPFNYNINLTCGHIGSQVCSDGSQYISWDGVHYTEAANSIIATKLLSTVYSTPPISFDFFCS